MRANYFLPENSEFYSHALKFWEGLERELNYNVMHSQRGHMILSIRAGSGTRRRRGATRWRRRGTTRSCWTASESGR